MSATGGFGASFWPAGREPEPYPRVDRWLRRRGRGVMPLTWDGARLLDDRLRMRRTVQTRTVACVFPLVALLPAVLAPRSHVDIMTIVWSANCVAFAAIVLLWHVGDRRIGRRQRMRVGDDRPRATTRGERIDLGLLLGAAVVFPSFAVAALVAGGSSHPALVHPVTSPGASALVVVVGTVVMVAVGLYAEFGSSALAVDVGSLRADRRLRADSVQCCAFWIMGTGPMLWSGEPSSITDVAGVAGVLFVAAGVWNTVAERRRPA